MSLLTSNRIFLVLMVLGLIVGVTIPGAVKVGFEAHLGPALPWSSFAHAAVFFLIALSLTYELDQRSWWMVVLLTLGLACLSESLQFLAIDRHPRWIDIGIDMSGVAAAGLAWFGLIVRWSRNKTTRATADGESARPALDPIRSRAKG